jgi:demethylmenaquinone methyltransferase/2-methoxy-6-polyprenyl-1,4-benzoquinol methylase
MDSGRDTIREAGSIRRMFGGIAGSYDLLNHLLSLGRDRLWRRRAVRAADARGPVLDVCAGTGDMALAWRRALPEDARVEAADFCSEMLVLLRRKHGAEGLGVAAGDTLRLPYPRDRFGAVSVAFGIRNVSDLRGGIREMRRVARPGGRVVILEFTTPANPLFRAVYLFYFMLVLPFIGNLVSGSGENAYGYLPRSVMNFPSRDRLVEIMTEEGLVDVRAHDLSLGIVNVFVGTKPSPEDG